MPTTIPATTMSSEFDVSGPRYDQRGPVRWLWSHLRRHPVQLAGFLGGSVVMTVLNAAVPQLTGAAFDAVLGVRGEPGGALTLIVLVLLVIVLGRGLFDLVAGWHGGDTDDPAVVGVGHGELRLAHRGAAGEPEGSYVHTSDVMPPGRGWRHSSAHNPRAYPLRSG